MPRRFALITGASAGIGRVFARQIARRLDLGLILTARRAERLQELAAELAPREVVVLPADIADPSARTELITEVSRRGLEVELLVNNAGFGSVGPFAAADPESQSKMVLVNCLAPVELTRALLPQMIARRSGYIINVCSTAAYLPMPYMGTYGATKAFLLSFSAALSAELSGSDVGVLALCPGPTESEFHLAAGLVSKIDVFRAMSAEAVVAQALDGVQRRRSIIINGAMNSLLARLGRAIPIPIAAALVRRVLKKYVPKG